MHTGGGAHCGKIGREASDKILPRSILIRKVQILLIQKLRGATFEPKI